MSPLWVAKYQDVVPAVFISFFEIIADPNTDSLRDNQLKNEIANIRASIEDSRYRTRYGVVLVSDDSVVNGPELEERVINIRRAARLDEKCLFFLDSEVPEDKLDAFASHVTSSMHTFAEEHYRDLTRHARRKRDKSSNISHTISRLGWIARYEFKLGIFAEFRNEMDVAERHYNSSMMALFDAQGPFETTSSWSPRWSETRLWSDCTFIRLIRSQLAIRTPTIAARSWTRHRDRMRDLLNRKGKGTENYGYLTWEARWTKVMAELIRDSSTLFNEPLDDGDGSNTRQATRAYAQVEKALGQDQQQPQVLVPWQYLHHAGYWLRKSISYTKKRLQLALEVPEEDRLSPSESPASSVARRSEAYDTYLSLEPHNEWQASQDQRGAQTLEIVSNLGRATGDFQAHNQQRSADQLRLELCQQLIQASQYAEAMSVLRPLWQRTKWRAEQWRDLLQQLALMLNRCAREAKDFEMQISTMWELSSSVFVPLSNFEYNTEGVLQQISSRNNDLRAIRLDNVSTLSCIEASFAFATEPAFVGEKLPGQLIIRYQAHKACVPITLRHVVTEFDENIPRFEITHDDEVESSEDGEMHILDINLNQHKGTTSLRFEPGQTKIFNLSLIPEKSGSAKVVRVITRIGQGAVSIEHTSLLLPDSSVDLTAQKLDPSLPEFRQYPNKTSVNVQPRPPKLDMSFLGLRNIYYTDETVKLELEMINGEEEYANIEIEILAQSDSQHVPLMEWSDAASEDASAPKLHSLVGELGPAETKSKHIVLEASGLSSDIAIEARAIYTLPSSGGRKIEKSATADVVIIKPFEAALQIFADHNPAPWPDYFHVEDDEITAASEAVDQATAGKMRGITSKWQSRAKITSFATDTLLIKTVSLGMSKVNQPARIDISPNEDTPEEIELVSNGQHVVTFSFDVQKQSMDESRSIVAGPGLDIAWQRVDGEQEVVHAHLQLPRSSFAGSEPRVLACQRPSESKNSIVIEYVIENPSMHFLTFSISIESSENYAFSGSKQMTVNLTPFSRHGIKFLFMPLTSGTYIQPDVKITDVYFNKVLNIIPTGSLRAENGELKAYIEKSDEHE